MVCLYSGSRYFLSRKKRRFATSETAFPQFKPDARLMLVRHVLSPQTRNALVMGLPMLRQQQAWIIHEQATAGAVRKPPPTPPYLIDNRLTDRIPEVVLRGSKRLLKHDNRGQFLLRIGP